jgi:small subunit ribosomal protein S7
MHTTNQSRHKLSTRQNKKTAMKNLITIKDYKNFLKEPLTQKFVNCLMLNGKKSVSEKILLDSLILIKMDNKNPFKTFNLAITNVKPIIEIRSIRRRRTKFKVPMPAPHKKRAFLAIKWILSSAKKRKDASIKVKLKNELILASKKQGEGFNAKIELHKEAYANRAFATYRWF